MGARRFRSLGVLALAATAWPRASRADDIEQVEVRGSAAGGFSSRAREADADREVTDAASLIEPLPGVHVRRMGADDGFATLSIRGSSSSQVAIYLAGVPLTGGADPSLDLATLPLWPGSQARVYRSFAPATIGPGSLGGTLVLDPPRVGAKTGTEVWGAVGSFGARRVRIGDVRALGGDARIVTALSASRSDDDFTFYDPDLSELAHHDVFTTRKNSGHAAVNGLVSYSVPVRWSATSAGALTVTTLAQARKQHLPGTVRFPTPFQELDSNRELGALDLSARAGNGVAYVRAWGRRENLRLRDVRNTLGPTRDDDVIVAAGSALGWRGGGHTLTLDARLDGSAERFAPGTYIDATQPQGATRASAGAAIDAEWRPADRLAAGLSSRLDGWSDAGAAAGSSGELRPTGHAGLEAKLGALALAAHGGAVARPPSFVERYGDRGAFIGDPLLRPESAWSVDLGGRLAAGSRKARGVLEVIGFATWAEDLIVFVPRGANGQAKATNVGRARLAGIEAELRGEALGFEARVSSTALFTSNDSQCASTPSDGTFGPGGSCERPPLPGRPTIDLVGDLAYRAGPLRVRYGVDALGGMVADLTGQTHVPARVLQSIGARLDVPRAPGLRIALDIRNFFDVRVATYQGATGTVPLPIGDVFDYPLPGRSFLLTARYAVPARP